MDYKRQFVRFASLNHSKSLDRLFMIKYYQLKYIISYGFMANQTVAYFISIVAGSKKLNKKEGDVLVRRLKRQTLKKIGRHYKLTGERIRQIEKTALVKLIKKIYQMILFD